MKWLVLISLFVASVAQAVDLPRVRTLNGHKVAFQSSEVRYVSSLNMYKARIVAKWGVHVFEVADAYFKCGEVRCRLQETRTRAFYESCKKAGESFKCQKRLRPTSDTPSVDYDRPGYWERHADDGEPRRENSGWEGSDFPERGDNDWETGGIVLF